MHGYITTDRLVLRYPVCDDADRITALVQDPRIHRNVGRIKANQSSEETQAFLVRTEARRLEGTGLGFAIVHGGELIGLVGGGRLGDHGGVHGVYDVGYWLAPEFWGRGLASEAFAAFLDHLVRHHGQGVFTAGYFEDNPTSGRVLRKQGFLPCGRGQYECLGRGELVACVDMVKVA